MTLDYEWIGVECNVPNDYGNEPHTHKEKRTIRHSFEVNVKGEDIAEYLMPISLQNHRELSNDEIKLKNWTKSMFEKMFDFLDDALTLDLDQLENDEYFVQFMKEKYEDDAWEDWERYNDEY